MGLSPGQQSDRNFGIGVKLDSLVVPLPDGENVFLEPKSDGSLIIPTLSWADGDISPELAFRFSSTAEERFLEGVASKRAAVVDAGAGWTEAEWP